MSKTCDNRYEPKRRARVLIATNLGGETQEAAARLLKLISACTLSNVKGCHTVPEVLNLDVLDLDMLKKINRSLH